ncbi:sphinganine C4-monooxygenase 2-like [Canna indica]|uniref:aldehyde oxygenase (deformylating) n=1 Tax=Canna indica TaxID=4628 RepID=A0AAQ3JLP2_9LILI|nr:sphinganine C4-monooxygenase 2-like [Canna indica]
MDLNWLASDDELMLMLMPIVVYWVYSGMYELLGSLDKYRLHSPRQEDTKNLASKTAVLKGVLLQQLIQATITLLVSKMTREEDDAEANKTNTASVVAAASQFLLAMFVFDTWQYFVHRCMHHNKFLYRKFHSWHHRIVAPYAFAAQYNHPLDGIATETLAGALAYSASGMSTSAAVVFFCFATVKGIDDHCGLLLPWNPFHLLFRNNTAFHHVHHQLAGNKRNFSQPFFVTWDKIFGTYADFTVVRRKNGGFEAQIANRSFK